MGKNRACRKLCTLLAWGLPCRLRRDPRAGDGEASADPYREVLASGRLALWEVEDRFSPESPSRTAVGIAIDPDPEGRVGGVAWKTNAIHHQAARVWADPRSNPYLCALYDEDLRNGLKKDRESYVAGRATPTPTTRGRRCTASSARRRGGTWCGGRNSPPPSSSSAKTARSPRERSD